MNDDLRRQEEESLDLDLHEDRYTRLRQIPWWEQERLASARFMVVGAGALGNEICKNLALLGIGRVFVVDMDVIEDHNLTRSALFGAEDEGSPKAPVVAEAVRNMNPDVRIQSLEGNVLCDVGLGVFEEMDLVFGALDNREARVYVNASCWKLGKPWIDGAIEVIQGMARMFVPPEGPCYECTMSKMDYKLLNMRRSCALLTREDVIEGKVPTTPTTASVIAGIQVQEAIKWLHRDRGMPLMAGKGFVFNGLTHDSYLVEYQRRADCPAHDHIDTVTSTEFSARTTTVGATLEFVRSEVSPEAVLEFDREICVSFRCRRCGTEEPVFEPLARLGGEDAACPDCGKVREPALIHAVYGEEQYLEMTLAELGLPLYDIVYGRKGMNVAYFLLGGDRDAALGDTAQG